MKKGKINIGYNARRIGYNGETRLVGKADRYSTITYEAIVAYAAKAAAVPESSIEMAMEAIFDAMNYFVLNGHSVQIPNLGTFSLGINCKSSQNESDFTQNFASMTRARPTTLMRRLPSPRVCSPTAGATTRSSTAARTPSRRSRACTSTARDCRTPTSVRSPSR